MDTTFRQEVQDLVFRAEREDMLSRLWSKDHTLWSHSGEEIGDRLGWLDLPRTMIGCRETLVELSSAARAESFDHVLLLGMGGSSLAPEVLARTFVPEPGYPQLIVLDSTVPDAVVATREAIDPARTLYVVSSKSGTTIEPLALMRYFWSEAASALGGEPGARFMAITDPGTPLVKSAQELGFRWVLENPPDVGGRYAALSLVGLVPAALMGLDAMDLLQRAGMMANACDEGVPPSENAGVVLAATLAAGAALGRDKLTVLPSGSLSAFGLWLEQLVAESLGKGGKGVVPVVGEPLLNPQAYGADRLFVRLRLPDEDGEVGEVVDDLERAGHPVIAMELDDAFDIGAHFLLWELGTALAGSFLGVQPFNQPDVEESKRAARRALEAFEGDGTRPDVGPLGSVDELLGGLSPGEYVAIMAFCRETAETEAALSALRRRIAERFGVATTSGYGPRFLHSTGQMHKGGPDRVRCLQLVTRTDDLAVPDAAYGFRTLVDAQAAGDLETLARRGRRVARVVLGDDVAGAILRIAEQVAG